MNIKTTPIPAYKQKDSNDGRIYLKREKFQKNSSVSFNFTEKNMLDCLPLSYDCIFVNKIRKFSSIFTVMDPMTNATTSVNDVIVIDEPAI